MTLDKFHSHKQNRAQCFIYVTFSKSQSVTILRDKIFAPFFGHDNGTYLRSPILISVATGISSKNLETPNYILAPLNLLKGTVTPKSFIH